MSEVERKPKRSNAIGIMALRQPNFVKAYLAIIGGTDNDNGKQGEQGFWQFVAVLVIGI